MIKIYKITSKYNSSSPVECSFHVIEPCNVSSDLYVRWYLWQSSIYKYTISSGPYHSARIRFSRFSEAFALMLYWSVDLSIYEGCFLDKESCWVTLWIDGCIVTRYLLSFVYDPPTTTSTKGKHLKKNYNICPWLIYWYKINASELLQNLEEMFSRY